MTIQTIDDSGDLEQGCLPHACRAASSERMANQYRVLDAANITDSLRADWQAMRDSSASYRSPFFSHTFVELVARHVPNAQVAVAMEGSRSIAILPFQRSRGKRARPVGLGINDAHGLLRIPDCSLQLDELLKPSELSQFAFHASPVELPGVADFEIGRTRSFLADLTVDPAGYEHHLRSTSSTIDRQGQKTRRMIRELGKLRFEFDCRDPSMLDRLIELKRQQYQRTHIFDILRVSWIRRLLHDLHQQGRDGLSGMLSVLYAGSTPVALHFGMREGDLLHYWFPVFEPCYAYGSPGTQLFLEVARQAADEGITQIDMGYGEQAYKHKLTNVITEMSYGLVDPNPLRRALYRSSMRIKSSLKGIRGKEIIKPMVRKLFPRMGGSPYDA